MNVFQRTSRNCRKLAGRKHFGLITCGSVRAQVSGTLKIDVREWFVLLCFPTGRCFLKGSFLEEVEKILGVQCRLGEDRAVQVVLHAVADEK